MTETLLLAVVGIIFGIIVGYIGVTNHRDRIYIAQHCAPLCVGGEPGLTEIEDRFVCSCKRSVP